MIKKEELIEKAQSRPWEVGYSHWGEGFVHCLFPELEWKDVGSAINGVAYVCLQDKLTFEEARRVVAEHNASLQGKP
jgi:hypothetical protein